VCPAAAYVAARTKAGAAAEPAAAAALTRQAVGVADEEQRPGAALQRLRRWGVLEQQLPDAAVVGGLVADEGLVQGLGRGLARWLQQLAQALRCGQGAAQEEELGAGEEQRKGVELRLAVLLLLGLLLLLLLLLL
jgi:hypothetical protein